jgi:RNase P subunit RPR2
MATEDLEEEKANKRLHCEDCPEIIEAGETYYTEVVEFDEEYDTDPLLLTLCQSCAQERPAYSRLKE